MVRHIWTAWCPCPKPELFRTVPGFRYRREAADTVHSFRFPLLHILLLSQAPGFQALQIPDHQDQCTFSFFFLFVFWGGNFCIPMSFWCAFTGAECFGRYKTNSKKSELLGALVLILSAIAFFLSYLLRDLMKVIG